MTELSSTHMRRADRWAGSLIAVSALLLSVWWLPDALMQRNRFAIWWTVGAWGLIALWLLLAGLGQRLPMWWLRRLWTAIPSLQFLLQALSFAAVRGNPADVMPWVWTLESTTVCLLVLQLRRVAAVTVSIVFSLSVPLSSWLFTGGVSQLVLSNTPVRLTNVLFVVLLIGVRHRLSSLFEVETEARMAADRRALSAAETRQRARFSRFVHDEVLSVLTAAQLFSGTPPPELRAEAAATIRALAVERPSAAEDARAVDPVDSKEAGERLRARIARLAPTAVVHLEADHMPIDAGAVETLGDAAAEAVRNAFRHSGGDHLSVRVTILEQSVDISVRDDGIGFDVNSIPPERLGVRQSIFVRVREIGGHAEVLSSLGHGTEVRLSWTTQ
ncbi:hypothetical protein C0Z11_09785 [Acidipropionibacterium jensenii]|uniref:sensor histidine kinase n=1 Tax=Acidipropionibacterium jensenii TaxID=1749 RepID=UPI000BC30AA0|nr:ATP-binding protein [Acidipropionibacterium jensenii]AZZ42524.1 hypothetical protein C0Z11_09785 [Acidipropionibacterium jensenii]